VKFSDTWVHVRTWEPLYLYCLRPCVRKFHGRNGCGLETYVWSSPYTPWTSWAKTRLAVQLWIVYASCRLFWFFFGFVYRWCAFWPVLRILGILDPTPTYGIAFSFPPLSIAFNAFSWLHSTQFCTTDSIWLFNHPLCDIIEFNWFKIQLCCRVGSAKNGQL
jgi:hypothetical protein